MRFGQRAVCLLDLFALVRCHLTPIPFLCVENKEKFTLCIFLGVQPLQPFPGHSRGDLQG